MLPLAATHAADGHDPAAAARAARFAPTWLPPISATSAAASVASSGVACSATATARPSRSASSSAL